MTSTPHSPGQSLTPPPCAFTGRDASMWPTHRAKQKRRAERVARAGRLAAR